VRINVSLVSAADGSVRWTEKYDRPLANVFAVQDEIARTVATTLLGTLGVRPPVGACRNRRPRGPRALSPGSGALQPARRPAPAPAIALFERASVRDPKYARAQASPGDGLAVLPAYVQDSTTPLVTSAVAAANRAIAMDSTIPESFTRAGLRYSLLGS
jgi:serine/threonine-protein kinase